MEGFSAAELPFVLFCILRLPESSVGYPKLPTVYIFFSFGQRKSISVLSDRNLSNHLTESTSPLTFYFLYCINHFGQSFYQFGTCSSSPLPECRVTATFQDFMIFVPLPQPSRSRRTLSLGKAEHLPHWNLGSAGPQNQGPSLQGGSPLQST